MATTAVDVRGFGAFARSNSLVLVNGRRLNDVDQSHADYFSRYRSIRSSASRSPAATAAQCSMATTRSAASSTSSPRAASAARRWRSAARPASARSTHAWPTSPPRPTTARGRPSFYGNAIKSDGYRDNNALDQKNGVGSLNYTTPDLKAFLTVTGDDQKLGFPGSRLGRSLDRTQRTRSPTARAPTRRSTMATRQGKSATTGFTKTIMNGVDLIVDGGYSKRIRQGAFFGPYASPQLLLQLCRGAAEAVVDHAAAEREERDLRPAVADPDRHRLLRRGLPPEPSAFHGFAADHRFDSRRRRLPAIGSRRSACCRQPTSPTAPVCSGIACRHGICTTELRPPAPCSSIAAPRPSRWTAPRPTMRCMPASSIASTTCSRCSAARRAHSARPTSTSAWPRDRPSIHFFNPIPRELPAQDPDLA